MVRVKQGDIIYINFDPQYGHEQKGTRPALVVSNDTFNKMNNMTVVCPITNSEPKTPLQIPIEESKRISGTILCDQIRSLDIYAKKYKTIDKASEELLENVLDTLQSMMER